MSKEMVILVHGLWVHGFEMYWLRRQFEKSGYGARQFSYHSVFSSPHENAADLNAFLENTETDSVHFVGHSLGGIVIRHLFHHFPQQRPGRVVTLGSPHNGSYAARGLSRFLPGRIILGKSIEQGLLGDVPPWPSTYELGSLAGSVPCGIGRVIPGLPRPSDGTVTIEETRLEGMADHIVLSASHTSMLYSRKVVYQTCYFLKNGRFDH